MKTWTTHRFAKFRPSFDAINKQCVTHYKPKQHLSVGESMITYFGKHGAKQYIHGKPIKFNCKLWVLAKQLDTVLNYGHMLEKTHSWMYAAT